MRRDKLNTNPSGPGDEKGDGKGPDDMTVKHVASSGIVSGGSGTTLLVQLPWAAWTGLSVSGRVGGSIDG